MEFKTFCIDEEIEYKEVYLVDSIFYKFYEIENSGLKKMFGFPDGMVDIQVGLAGGKIFADFVGSFSKGGEATTADCEKCIGIKIKPGYIHKDLMGRMEELNDCMRISILNKGCISEEQIYSILNGSSTVEERIKFMMNLLCRDEIVEQHEIAGYVIKAINSKNGNINVADIIEKLGYSHRYSDKVFKNNMGFSIKKYAGIYRLQQAINLMSEKDEDICYELGYYDQSHFIHDFKKFTTFTPKEFMKVKENMLVV